MRTPSFRALTTLAALILPVLSIKDGVHAASLLRRQHGALDDPVHYSGHEMVESHLVRRIPAPDEPQVIANNLTGADPANIDQAQLDSVLSTACAEGLTQVDRVSDDAGVLGCYNIPFLNTNTGVFSADLRLYQLSTPRKEFAGVPPTQISVQLSYANAAFSVVPNEAQTVKRESALQVRQATDSGAELQTFLFVGQVNNDLSLDKLEDTELMALLIPSIQLSAAKPDGAMASTNLTSSSMWFFVAGVFQGQNDAGAAAATPEAIGQAADKAAEFTLPGTTLGALPVGLIITLIWTLLFAIAIGYGTWGRMQFRDQFRVRKAREAANAGSS